MPIFVPTKTKKMIHFKNIEEARQKKITILDFLNKVEPISDMEVKRINRAEKVLKSANEYILNYNKKKLDELLR